MRHETYKNGDSGAPEAILDRNGEVVLSLCKTCGGAEGAMPSECPGYRIPEQQLDSIYAQQTDFRGGKWLQIAEFSQGDRDRDEN